MMQGVKLVALLAGVVVGVGCTKPNPEFCESDTDCKESARPFCDVAGEFEESDFTNNTCSARPEGCPVERCGCTPDETRCEGDQLSVCDADGKAFTTSTCALGCATDGTRCLTFEPSNDLGGALRDAGGEPEVILPAGARIDTGTGVVTTSGGATIVVPSRLVPQGATMIRVFMASSFVIDDTIITGPHAFAAVAPGPIVVKGRVDASANGLTGGPGAVDVGACVGQFAVHTQCGQGDCAPGAGGGGNVNVGGQGGGLDGRPRKSGGAAQTSFAPLVGGCRGGNHRNTGGTVLNEGGAGGGAVQLVSLATIEVVEFGFIDLGGGGGHPTAGGGSGGTLVLEAPSVKVAGSTAGVTANGGAGGACVAIGADASPTLTAAVAPMGCTYPGGNGGIAAGPATATDASYCIPTGGPFPTFCIIENTPGGGGGGAVGRMRIATSDGTFEQTGDPLVSVTISTATLTTE